MRNGKESSMAFLYTWNTSGWLKRQPEYLGYIVATSAAFDAQLWSYREPGQTS